MLILLELKALFEKAKSKNKPKRFHQDYIDLETWKSVIGYVFKTLKIKDKVQADNTFPDLFASKLYSYLDTLPSLDGISQEQLLELTDYLAEVFDLLLTNQDAKKIISDLDSILKLIAKFEVDIPDTDQSVGIKAPELPAEEPAPDATDEVPPEDGTEDLPPEEDATV